MTEIETATALNTTYAIDVTEKNTPKYVLTLKSDKDLDLELNLNKKEFFALKACLESRETVSVVKWYRGKITRLDNEVFIDYKSPYVNISIRVPTSQLLEKVNAVFIDNPKATQK